MVKTIKLFLYLKNSNQHVLSQYILILNPTEMFFKIHANLCCRASLQYVFYVFSNFKSVITHTCIDHFLTANSAYNKLYNLSMDRFCTTHMIIFIIHCISTWWSILSAFILQSVYKLNLGYIRVLLIIIPCMTNIIVFLLKLFYRFTNKIYICWIV